MGKLRTGARTSGRFGVVVYEMLTGWRAFPGESVTEILAGVLRGEPNWSALPASTPLRIRKLLGRCLERDRQQRLQAIGEARIEIKAELAEESASDSIIIAGVFKRHKKAAIGSVAVVAALVALTWFLLHPPSQAFSRVDAETADFQLQREPCPERRHFSRWQVPCLLGSGRDSREAAFDRRRAAHPKAGRSSSQRLLVMSIRGFPTAHNCSPTRDEPGGHKSMWTVSVLGQSPRQLREDASGFEVSPDGTHIAFSPLGAWDCIGKSG